MARLPVLKPREVILFDYLLLKFLRLLRLFAAILPSVLC